MTCACPHLWLKLMDNPMILEAHIAALSGWCKSIRLSCSVPRYTPFKASQRGTTQRREIVRGLNMDLPLPDEAKIMDQRDGIEGRNDEAHIQVLGGLRHPPHKVHTVIDLPPLLVVISFSISVSSCAKHSLTSPRADSSSPARAPLDSAVPTLIQMFGNWGRATSDIIQAF